jgi:hypothetical protein
VVPEVIRETRALKVPKVPRVTRVIRVHLGVVTRVPPVKEV